jgi:hypothetical protein
MRGSVFRLPTRCKRFLTCRCRRRERDDYKGSASIIGGSLAISARAVVPSRTALLHRQRLGLLAMYQRLLAG